MQLLNTGPEPFFEDVVDHMAAICSAPVALVHLTRAGRQWISGENGAKGHEAAPHEVVRPYGFLSRQNTIVEDVATLNGAPPPGPGAAAIRAYVTAPLTIGGAEVGLLCIAHFAPRKWSEFELAYMARSARLVAGHFEARAALAERDRRIQLERELAEAAALNTTVIESLHEGLVVQDELGRFIACNPAGLDILGLTEDQLYGRTSMDERWRVVNEAGDGIAGGDHPQMIALATGEPVLGRVFGVERPSGERRWVQANAMPLRNADGGKPTRVVTTFHDITERLGHQQAIAAALAKAERAALSKQQFLANMSHEIRTPLNGILGMAQVLDGTSLDAAQREFIATILQSGQTLMALLNDVLDLSKIEAGKFDITPAEASLRELLSRQALLWTPRAAEKGLALKLEIDPALPDVLSFDPTRVQQCVANLVSNAVKFTENGEIRILATCTPASDGAVTATIDVVDTGPGMDAETQARLFQPFAQADETISRKHGGTGLGLSITRRLAELMGGAASVRSAPGQGSTFSITFRAEPVAAPRPRYEEMPADLIDCGTPRDVRVLLVDDHAVNRQIARLFLRPCNARVTEAKNGAEALDALSRETFDLVLLDMHMPVMDGPSTVRAIRASGQAWAHIPVIALTADALSGDRSKYLAMGMNGYLSKPLAEREFFTEIGRVFNSRALAAA